jgi:endonuclease YncB( thermonuclease family)
MIVLVRILLALALAYVIKEAHDQARGTGAAGLFDSLFYIGLVFILALANAAVWAPYFGSRVADAVAGDGPPVDVPPKKTGLAWVLSLTLRLGTFALLVALAFWIWQYRAMFEPVQDLVRAWRLGHAPWSAAEQELLVTRVIDTENLQARDAEGRLLTIRLAGIESVTTGRHDAAAREQAQAAREFLTSLVLSNTVHVEVALTNEARVWLGFVRVGDTNLNAAYIAAGHASFRPDYLGNASLRSRWTLLQAERRAQPPTPADPQSPEAGRQVTP